jgi:hypothetical protein
MQPALPCDPAERVRRAHHQIESETMERERRAQRSARSDANHISRARNPSTQFYAILFFALRISFGKKAEESYTIL